MKILVSKVPKKPEECMFFKEQMAEPFKRICLISRKPCELKQGYLGMECPHIRTLHSYE